MTERERDLTAAFAAGYRAGQEGMRQRAMDAVSCEADRVARGFSRLEIITNIANAIGALPIKNAPDEADIDPSPAEPSISRA